MLAVAGYHSVVGPTHPSYCLLMLHGTGKAKALSRKGAKYSVHTSYFVVFVTPLLEGKRGEANGGK
jgi:hypothetical protein